MLYLESFVHRVALAEVVSRWVVNRPEPGDVLKLKTIVNFNAYMARVWGRDLATSLLARLHGRPPRSFTTRTKGDLKDFIVAHPSQSSPRIEELLARYRRFPEDFYRDTPFDGRVYVLDDGPRVHFAGASRVKRFRRIAEKGSRRIVDFLFERIRANADALAEERARELGVPKHQLITPEEVQVEEFAHAERRLLKQIRLGTIHHEFPILTIPDVVGFKVIADGEAFQRLVRILDEELEACSLLEQETHSGSYNAINLRVAYTLPRALLLANPPGRHALHVMARRGLDPTHVAREYPRFVEEAEDHVLLEIIVSSYPEFVESEIGRSMHEERVLRQRENREYRGHLATNVRHLMNYILTLCLAPGCDEVTDVPVKLWVKYMPDTIERLLRKVLGYPVDLSFEEDAQAAAEERPSMARTAS